MTTSHRFSHWALTKRPFESTDCLSSCVFLESTHYLQLFNTVIDSSLSLQVIVFGVIRERYCSLSALTVKTSARQVAGNAGISIPYERVKVLGVILDVILIWRGLATLFTDLDDLALFTFILPYPLKTKENLPSPPNPTIQPQQPTPTSRVTSLAPVSHTLTSPPGRFKIHPLYHLLPHNTTNTSGNHTNTTLPIFKEPFVFDTTANNASIVVGIVIVIVVLLAIIVGEARPRILRWAMGGGARAIRY